MTTTPLVAARAQSAPHALTLYDIRLLGLTISALSLRIVLLQELTYGFLVWNLVLAYAPLLLCRLHQRYGHRWGGAANAGLFCGWLLFLPNAPYLVTDFVHPLRALAAGHLTGAWLGLVITAGSTVLALGWFLRAMRYFDEALDVRGCGAQARALACAVVIGACAVGVWLGRLLRFNTWDVVVAPGRLIEASLSFLADVAHLELVAVTALVLWGLWRGYVRWRWILG